MKAKLVSLNVPTSDSGRSNTFYSALIGMDLVESLGSRGRSTHAPLSNEGHWIWLSDRMDEDERITAVFAVDNLHEAITELTAVGGSLMMMIPTPIAPAMRERYQRDLADTASRIAPPPGSTSGAAERDAPKSMGNFALMEDPDGNVIGLLEPEEHGHRFYRVGRYAVPLNQEVMEDYARSQRMAAEQRDIRARQVRGGR